MVEIVSTYAQKVGQLVVNLASRNSVKITMGIEESVVSGKVLTLRATIIKSGASFTVSETLPEQQVEGIADVAVVADAIYNKLLRGQQSELPAKAAKSVK